MKQKTLATRAKAYADSRFKPHLHGCGAHDEALAGFKAGYKAHQHQRRDQRRKKSK